MKKRKIKTVYTAVSVGAAVAVAVVCRAVSRAEGVPLFIGKLCNVLRTLIYLGLFAGWGVTVYRRVVQVQARKFLALSAGLMLVWMILRAFKFHFIANATAVRYLWYAYYAPMLFIPTLALFVALSIGRHEGYRLPKRAFLLAVPAAALVLVTLANDFHGWVFRFPEGIAPSESNYSYGWAYILNVAWGVSCGAASLALMFVKSRLPKKNPALWIPVIPFAVVIIYVAAYAMRVPFILAVGWDLAAFECLAFAVFFESCIACGLIQSNTRYAEAFRASRNLSVQIFDEDYNLKYYSEENVSPADAETLRSAEKSPVFTGDGKLLHNMPVRGGRAAWTEDISELLAARETLQLTREELKDRNEFLRYSYRKEEEYKTVEEQNRLYDLLQSKTQRQINGIERRVKEYRAEKTDEERRRLVAEIIVLGSYIKRRKDFVLLAENTALLPGTSLENALAESFRALGLCGIKGTFAVRTGDLSVSALTLCYDFFEEVIEAALGKAKYINARVAEVNGLLRIAVTLDCAVDAARVLSLYSGAETFGEEGETEFILPLGGAV